MMTKRNGLITGLAAAGLLLPLAALHPVARAENPAAPKAAAPSGSDPQAVRLLTEMAAAYKTLNSYSDMETATGDPGLGLPYEMSLTYQRPGRMIADITHHYGGKAVQSHFLLDGKALYLSSAGAPGRVTCVTGARTNYTLADDAFIAREEVKDPLIPDLLEENAMLTKALLGPNTLASLGQPSVVDGVPVDTIILRSRQPNIKDITVMQIGRTDHLLRRDTSDWTNSPDMAPSHTDYVFTEVHANPAILASTFVFTPSAGTVVVTEGAPGSDADPAAVALLSKMYAAYKDLSSFSCNDMATVYGPTYGPNNTMTIQTNPAGQGTVAIEKPYKVVLTRTSNVGTTRAVSDGKTLYVTTTEPNGEPGRPIHALANRYLRIPLLEDPANIGWNLSNFGGLPDYGGGQHQLFIPNVMVGWTPMPASAYDWKLGSTSEINGEPVDTVTLRENDQNDANYSVLTLAISRRDHLLRQVSTTYHNGDQPEETEDDTFTNVQVNPALPASLFTFTPPPGSLPVPRASLLIAKR